MVGSSHSCEELDKLSDPPVMTGTPKRKRASVALSRRSSITTQSHLVDVKSICVGIPQDLPPSEKLIAMLENSIHYTLRSMSANPALDLDMVQELTQTLREGVADILETVKASSLSQEWAEKLLLTEKESIPIVAGEVQRNTQLLQAEVLAWDKVKEQMQTAREAGVAYYRSVESGIEVITDEQRAKLPAEHRQFLKAKPDYEALISRNQNVMAQLANKCYELNALATQAAEIIAESESLIQHNVCKLGESLGLHEDITSIMEDLYS